MHTSQLSLNDKHFLIETQEELSNIFNRKKPIKIPNLQNKKKQWY